MQLPKSLVEGYRRFLRDRHLPEKGRYLQLAELGQAPTAMVIACCDARLDVSAIFDAEPGALFIMRNVANLVPPYEPEGRYHGTSAAIEYAAMVLKVPHIILLGHSRCGGVRAYREQIRDKADEQGFIGRWLALLDDAKVLKTTLRYTVRRSPSNLPPSAPRSRISRASRSFASARRGACSRCMGCTSISAAAG